MSLQTDFPFTLPVGYKDSDGVLHREGVMRLATAYDEIAPLGDPRVQKNPGYLCMILLSRVVVRLGDIGQINPKTMEGLYSADLAFLQDFYARINAHGHSRFGVTCPHCEGTFEVEVDGLGG